MKALAFVIRKDFYQPILECGHTYRLIKKIRLDGFSCHWCERNKMPFKSRIALIRKYDKRPRLYYSKVGHRVENIKRLKLKIREQADRIRELEKEIKELLSISLSINSH